jgi:lycopene cyclase CruA
VFHYARADELPPHPLLSLYGRFFRLRSRYKRGASENTYRAGAWTDGVSLERLTYGIIPGWSRLTPAPSASVDGLLLVGDAAARHSPLTFCGFGSMVRSFLPIANGLVKTLDRGDLSSETLSSLAPEPEVLAGVGALALLLAKPRRTVDPAATNRLLDAAFKSLYEAGEETYASLLQDRMSARRFAAFLLSTSRIRTEVYLDAWSFLSPREFARWATHVAQGFARSR